ncbi:MAG: Ig-like domain-containing protein, partial [Muribaculaceae bacterium]|nr:Ig-like domain-containing protein [Muribaculaceae bacterium]
QKLADIIISGKLTEDSGMNVGIGGWEDDGEDFGGTVKAPAINTRSAEETRFYMRNPKSEGDGRYSMEFGISEGNEAPAAILFNIRLPREMSFDESKTVVLDPSVAATHKLYGTPKFIKENPGDEWNDDHVLRFIVMSSDLSVLPVSTGKLGSISYIVNDCWGEPYFKNCQVAMPVSGGCTDIPEHGGDYSGNFKPIEVSSVWFDQSDMTLTEGDEGLLFANIDPWDATDQNLVWTSSDESIATVSTEDGRNAIIKAVKEGESIITATSSNGLSASCTIKVEKRFIEVQEITLSQYNLNIVEGESAVLTATVNPSDATDKSLSWSSSDPSIASVSADGVVT